MHVLGIGTDIIECLRIAKMIERYGERFLCRVFTNHEIGYCQRRHAASQHFSGHWAAKEAVLKTLGAQPARGLSFRDMEIRNDDFSAPQVAFRGNLRDVVERTGIQDFRISISHCRTHATALVVALGQSDPEPEQDG